MADDANEDSWLYGTSNPDSTTNDDERTTINNTAANTVDISTKSENEALAAIIGGNLEPDGTVTDGQDAVEEETEMGEFEDLAHEMEEDEDVANDNTIADTTDVVKKEEFQDGASEDDVDDDDSDDDINVVIGEMKAPSTYNIKQRSNLLAGVGTQDKGKSSSQGGKFSIEDFEGVGGINGVAAHEFSIDSLEEKPWRKPGADITDYFNYGFNEETWRAYCERQKRFRVVESGVGLASLTQNLNPSQDRQHAMEGGPQQGLLHPGVITQGVPAPISEHMQIPPPSLMPPPNSHQGPPPRFGIIPRGPRSINTTVSKENAIQVMTAECREYSRTGQMMSNFGGIGPVEDTYFHEPEPFDYGYEPTQEQSWGNENSNWVPTGIKELTPGPGLGPPPPQMTVPPQMSGPPPQIRPPHPQGTMAPNIPPSMPPNIPNIAMGPPPPIGLIMGASTGGPPPIRMPMGPPRMIAPNAPLDRIDEDRDRDRRRREREWERERERERERDRDRDTSRSRRERSRSREKSRRRSKSREKEREKDRDKERDRERERERDRGRDTERERERERNEKTEDIERPEEERERRRRERDRERERERDRERSRRDRSRSREKSRRRSKSRDKERERSSKTATSSTSTSSSRSDKKKSHRKEDDE